MEIVKITKRVILHPKYLDANILVHLLEQIQNLLENNCDKDYGYILTINRVISIQNHFISQSTSDIIFNVKCEAQVIKPVKDMIIEGTVKIVLQEGLFVDVLNKFQVFVADMGDYVFNEHDQIFETTTNQIKIENIVNIKIVEVDYNNNKFIAFGQIEN